MQLLNESRSRLLERGCLLGVAALGLYEAFHCRFVAVEVTALALLVCVAALLPGWLWVRRVAPGYPLFPVMALTYLWTYGLPGLNQHAAVAAYPAGRQAEGLAAALLFLVLSTLAWLAVARLPARPPARLLQFDRRATVPILLAGLAGATLYQLNGSLRLLPVPARYASVFTALSIAAVSVASPSLAFLLGQGKLGRRAGAAYVLLLGAYVLAHLSSLYIGSVVTLGVCVIAYSIASGRVPFVFLAALLVALTVLHLGKGEMRAKYWASGRPEPVKPWDYPAFFQEWVGAGLERAVAPAAARGPKASQGPLERSSLLWVLLRLQEQIPARKPFLHGQTYEIIPGLLVPRFLNESKAVAIRGNQILAVYSGLTRNEDQNQVTIGFGFLAEAYANFGWAGVGALAVGLGALLGQLSRWGGSAPVISFRGTLAILVLVTCLQAESTAGGAVSALFQQSALLLALACVLMRPLPVSDSAAPAPAPAAA